MAQAGTNICAYVCRSCRNSLRKEGPSSRQFSTTKPRRRTIPEFVPTTSPGLNNLLREWRQKVFTPAVLAAHHQALIYKKSRHDILINDPGVTVTLSNGEDVKLEPMERWDKPNKQKSLTEMANVLGANPDGELWANLQPFLEGMKTAKYELPVSWLEKITRKANEQGKQGIILQCAQMAKKTNMRLSLRGVARELLLGCHLRAAKAGFSYEEVEQAAKTANRIVLMMEDPQHCGRRLQEGHTDMRRDPLVFAILLEFAAGKALHLQSGKDTDGEVGNLVTKLLLFSQTAGGLINETTYVSQQQQILEDLVIFYNAIEMAMKVDMKGSLGKDNIMKAILDLKKLSTELEQKINQHVETRSSTQAGKSSRGLVMWEMVQKSQKAL